MGQVMRAVVGRAFGEALELADLAVDGRMVLDPTLGSGK
jgi:hypothetical protein